MYTVQGIADPSEMVDLGDGVVVPSQITVTVTGDIEVTLKVAVRDGRFICESIHADEVTTELLRMIPVRGLIRDGVLSAVGLIANPMLEDFTNEGPTDDALYAAAVVYKLAYALGDPPTKAVAVRLNMGYSTASRWIRLARDRGFLSETRRGKAGV